MKWSPSKTYLHSSSKTRFCLSAVHQLWLFNRIWGPPWEAVTRFTGGPIYLPEEEALSLSTLRDCEEMVENSRQLLVLSFSSAQTGESLKLSEGERAGEPIRDREQVLGSTLVQGAHSSLYAEPRIKTVLQIWLRNLPKVGKGTPDTE